MSRTNKWTISIVSIVGAIIAVLLGILIYASCTNQTFAEVFKPNEQQEVIEDNNDTDNILDGEVSVPSGEDPIVIA